MPQKYTLLNPYYERRWKIERDMAIGSAVKDEKDKEKKDKEKEKDKEKDKDKRRQRSKSKSKSPTSSDHSSSKKSSGSSSKKKKEEQDKIRRKSEELLRAERESNRSVKELDDEDMSSSAKDAPPATKAPEKTGGIKLKLLKGQKTQKPVKATPVVIIGKAPCFRPSFLSGKAKPTTAASAKTEEKPYGPALPPDLAAATSEAAAEAAAKAAALVAEAKKNEVLEIPLPVPPAKGQSHRMREWFLL